MDESVTTERERKYYKSWQDRLDKGKTFKDFSLFRPKILTMWNTSSYASGPGLEAGVDKDTLEVSNDSTSQPSTKTAHPRKLRKRVILAIAFGIGAIVAALVPVVLIFYLPKAEPSEVVSTVEVQATVQNMKFTEALDNKNSLEYRNFTSEFCSEVEAVYKTNDLKDTYDGCLVTDLRNGSIIVIFQVVFIAKVIPTEIQIKSSLLSTTKETTDTGQILVSLGVFLLAESTVIVETVTIIEAADNPVPKIAYGDSCRVTSSCKTDWAECSGQRCTCPSSRYISHQYDSCFMLGSSLGGKCSATCSVSHAECDDSPDPVCVCSPGYYNKDDTCESKIAFEDPCSEIGQADQCATFGAGCNNNKCSCNETHFHYQLNDTCLQLGSILGEACSGECADPNSACEQDEGFRCICDHGYYARDGTCEEKLAFDDPCAETGPADQCATFRAGCINNKCSCTETHFHYQQNDTCLQLGSILGEACSGECADPNSACEQDEGFRCICDLGYYDRDGTCVQKIAFDDPCAETGSADQCATFGAGCINNKCSCNETHFHYQQNDTCLQLGSILGEACSDGCDIAYAVCGQDQESICICDVGYYKKDETCELTTKPETSPTTTTITQATTTSSRTTLTTQMSSTAKLTESTSPFPSTMMSKTMPPTSSLVTTTATSFSHASSTTVMTSTSLETQTATLTTSSMASTSTLMTTTPTSSAGTVTSTTTETIKTVPSSVRLTATSSSALRTTSASSTKMTKTTPATTLETQTASTSNTMVISSTPSQTATIKAEPSTSVTASNSQTSPPSTLSLTSAAKTVLTSLLKSTMSISVSTPTTMSTPTSSEKSPTSSTTITIPTVTTPTVTKKPSSASLPITTTVMETSTSSTINKAATTPTEMTTETSSTVMPPSTTSTMTATQTSPATATNPKMSATAAPTQISTGEVTLTSLAYPTTTITTPPTTTPNSPHSLESTVSIAVSTQTTMSSPTSSHRVVTPTLLTTDKISTSSSKETPSSLSSTTAPSSSTSITTKSASTPLITLTYSSIWSTPSSFTSMVASTSSTTQLISSTKALTPSSLTSKPSLRSSTTVTVPTVTAPTVTTKLSPVSLPLTTTTMEKSTSSTINKAVSTPTETTTQLSSTVMPPSTTSTMTASQTSPATATKPTVSAIPTSSQKSTGEVTSTSLTSSTTTMTTAPTTTPNSPHSPTSGIPYIYFESLSHVAVIGKMTSFVCFVHNVPHTESITVTRGNKNEPVITVNANGDVEKHISNFEAVDESDTLGTHVIRISFMTHCDDAAKYYCESAGMINATDIYILGKPELTLSYEIVEGQEPWGDRPSLCEGELGRIEGSFVVEVLSSGSFVEYTDWWKGDMDPTETDCGTYKTQKFFFKENTLEFLNNKQIRCAIKTAETFTEQELPVSEEKTIHVIPSNYCDDNTFEVYEHPYECHYFVNCKTVEAEGIRFQYCGNTKCPNHTLANCDRSSCDKLCNREFTIPTTSTTTTLPPGVPRIKCVLRSALAKVGGSVHYSCSLQYVDKVTRIDIPELNYTEESSDGISGLFNIDTDMTLNVSMSDGYEVGISYENIQCQQEGDITIRINNEASDIISVRTIAEAEIPTLSMKENVYKNQDMTITCSGIVGRQEDGSPVATLEFQVKFHNAVDFSTYTEGRETTTISDSCTNNVTKEIIIYPNDRWSEAKVRCITIDDTNEINNPSEFVGPLTLLEPAIYFDATSHVTVIGQKTSFTCFVHNVLSGESISVTRGNTKEPVITIYTSGDVEKHISNFDVVDDVDTQGQHVIRINFTSQCGDAAKYFCEHSGMSTATDIYVLSKPELTLSYEIVEGQVPWGGRPSWCEGYLGGMKGSFVVEVLSSGSFAEYTEWWEIDMESRETDCGLYKKQNFVFNEDTLDFLRNKQIRCAIKTAETFTKEELPVSEEKTIRVIPSSYCDDNTFEVYEHAYECHYFVDCKNGRAGDLRFKHCGNTTCPNHILGFCDESSCDELCHREFTIPTTTVPSTRGTDPYIDCNKTVNGDVGGDATIHCILGNTDSDSLTNIIIYKNQSLLLDVTGNSGTQDSADNSATVIYTPTTISLKLYNLGCEQSVTYRFFVNDLLEYSVTVSADKKPIEPVITLPNFKRNQLATVRCDGNLGFPDSSQNMYIEKKMKEDTDFTAVVEGITEVVEFIKEECAYMKTVYFTFYATNAWEEAQLKCATNTEKGNLYSEPAPITDLGAQEIYFNPEHPTSEIGYLLSMNCTVSGVSDLTSIRITRYEPPEDVCSVNDGGVTSSIDHVACIGELKSDTGAIQIEFSAVQCDDEGDYFCEANPEASTSTRTSLAVTRAPTRPTMTSEAKALTENKQMLEDEYFVCEAGVGYPTAGSIILQNDRNGGFEKVSLASETRDSSPDTCRANETLEAKLSQLDNSWNNTKLRCAVEDDTGTIVEFDEYEFTILLIPGNYCNSDNQGDNKPHPYECHSYITCSNGFAYVNSCPAQTCPSFPNGELTCDTCSTNCP